ncbi:AAA family ATPase [Clostridium sp. 'White wine YQ']|uniref:AAA family ATPase n=1 Tax=Clostridium sp. 'White wine YQ' TaxID=3027474 RepID=UPI002366279A|nr:AAA family ATPase [Clostridium sp. 'White wine YQ']MDD7792795.1 AAA family ATPase [Clostridium sp. 'White wine YQ']
MIIKDLKIKRFGNLKNKELSFKAGINIVYGGNEAGKSTLQNFIKVWLYGISTKRNKSLRDNLRTRYAIYNSERSQGELLVNNKNEDLRIIRSFGSTKKEDNSNIIDEISGSKVSEISLDEPGKDLFNISLSSFENTLFIKGLGTYVSSSKDDEVMHRLTNSFESGEEGVSYFKAIAKLELLRKSIITTRGNGELDKFKEIKDKLIEEREDFLITSNKNIEDESRLIDIKKEKEETELKLKKLDFYKKHIKKMKLQKEYKDILEYLRKSQELKKLAEGIEGELKSEEGLLDREKVEAIKEDVAVLLSFNEVIESKLEEEQEIEKERKSIEEILEDNKIIIELGNDLEEKTLKLYKEIEVNKSKILVYEENIKEIDGLKSRLNEIKLSLGKGVNIEGYEDDIDSTIKEYEELLFMLKDKINYRHKEDLTKEIKKKKNSNFIITLLIILGITSSIALAFVKPSFSIIPLFFVGFLLNIRFKLSKDIENLTDDKYSKERLKEIEEKIIDKENKLNEYVNMLKFSSLEELGVSLRKYKRHKEEIRVLGDLIKEREEKSYNGEISEIRTRYLEDNKMLNTIFGYAGCDSLEALLLKIKDLKEVLSREKIVNARWKDYSENLKSLNNEKERKEKNLYDKLEVIGFQDIPLNNLNLELDKILDKLKEKDQVQASLKSVEETYKVLLKDRDLENINKELEYIINDNLDYSFETEEEVDFEIKQTNLKLINIEKELKDVENSIYNRFLGKRSLITIEGDLQETLDNINELSLRLKGVELSIELLEESFKELQKNMGPVLNEKVSYYFSKLTSGKYKEVKVSQNYELVVVQDKGDILSGELLSNGAWDQVYLSLRLALVDMLFKEEKVPLIFDDAFVQYDDNRLKNVLEVLSEISYKRQIILFSCQKREVEILKNMAPKIETLNTEMQVIELI